MDIRKYVYDNDITLGTLAEMIGITQSHLSLIIHDKCTPRPGLRRKIKSILSRTCTYSQDDQAQNAKSKKEK